jgi:hypothetical protein
MASSEILVPAPDDPVLRELAGGLAEQGGDTVSAILLYGSHLHDSDPDPWSAYDFLVIVDRYGPFYRALARAGFLRRPPGTLRALSYVLPPNIIAFRLARGRGALAKCAVYRPTHFQRALGRYALDHFLKGRVTQRIALVWSRGPSDDAAVASTLQKAREGTARWVRPYLPRSFSVEEFAETMLEVSYSAEIRPERPDRVSQVFKAQREALVEVAEASLQAAVASGMAREVDGAYRWVALPGWGARTRMRAYFALSKIRATVRWAKYVVTFDGWLDYLLKKVERRGGLKVELRERERRWPLLLLWPKMFRVLRSVRRDGPDGGADGNEHSP